MRGMCAGVRRTWPPDPFALSPLVRSNLLGTAIRPQTKQTLPPPKRSTPSSVSPQPTRPAVGPLAPILLAPGVLSVRHWDRLLGGLLYAAAGRLNWQLLLRRTFAIDLQRCPMCHGRMRVISAIHEPDVANAILKCLGMPTEVPATARARDPTDDDDLGGSTDERRIKTRANPHCQGLTAPATAGVCLGVGQNCRRLPAFPVML
jgi:hypothetical protein